MLASVKLSAQNIFTVQHPYWYVVVSDRDSESVMIKVRTLRKLVRIGAAELAFIQNAFISPNSIGPNAVPLHTF